MIAKEKLNRLTDGQQKSLHESVAKFIEENLQKMKDLSFVDEVQLTGYLEKVAPMREELRIRKANPAINDALCTIMIAAEARNDSVAQECIEGAPTTSLMTRFIKHFTMIYQQMKNLDECLTLLHSLYGEVETDAKNNATSEDGGLIRIDEFAAVAESSITATMEDDVVFVNYNLPITRENWQLIRNLSELHISLGEQKYVAKTGDFFIESSKDDLGEQSRHTGRICVNRLTSVDFVKEDKSYFRYLIPIGSVDWLHDIRTFAAFIKNGWAMGLIELTDENTLLHVYPCNDGGKKYMVVESLTETTSSKMAEYVYSVSLTLGFITGTIHLGKCYEFSSEDSEFKSNVAMAYHTMRPSSETGMRIFTTNMYYVREVLKYGKVALMDKEPLYDEKGELQEHLQDWLQPDMMQSLFSLIQNDQKVARAVVTLIESANFPLEYQTSIRAVVLETLSHSKPGEPPIPGKRLWKHITEDFTAIVDKYENNISEEERISTDGAFVLRKKIGSVNNPTNADSLVQPFVEIGYSLSDNDMTTIKMRDKLLHGHLVNGTLEEQTENLFYFSLMFHKLSCIFILRRAGFKGYILNNAVLFNCKRAVSAGEKALLMI